MLVQSDAIPGVWFAYFWALPFLTQMMKVIFETRTIHLHNILDNSIGFFWWPMWPHILTRIWNFKMSNLNHMFLVQQHLFQKILVKVQEECKLAMWGHAKNSYRLLYKDGISSHWGGNTGQLPQNRIFILTPAGLKPKERLLFSTKICVLLEILLNRTDSKDFLTPG